jgi:hypothetical protein
MHPTATLAPALPPSVPPQMSPSVSGGVGGQPRPQSLQNCLPNPPVFLSAHVGAARAPWPPGGNSCPTASTTSVHSDTPTSATPPPPFTWMSVVPELQRSPQHRLPPGTTSPFLLVAAMDSPSAPWTSPPPERGGGLSRPHNLPGCHPHLADTRTLTAH